MAACDPRGFYNRLGVDPNASVTAIKEAFRRRAKDVHPDRNTRPDAKRDFQTLVEAYEVLSDPHKRAEYDALNSTDIIDQTIVHGANGAHDIPPVRCSRCGVVTAQPRYVIYWQIVSLLIVTIRRPIQGVFCRDCADRKAILASLATWCFGWWGIPWGPIWSFYYLAINLTGGEKPADANAALLGQQALAFAQESRYQLARGTLRQALYFVKNPDLRNTLEQMDRSFGKLAVKDGYKLKNVWHPFQGIAFFVQIIPVILIPIVLIIQTNILYPVREAETSAARRPAPLYHAAPTLETAPTNMATPAVTRKWYVTADGLNIRQAPSPRQATIGEALPKFTTLSLLQDSDDLWAKVQVADGRVGYVRKKYIMPGDGEQARVVECNNKAGVPIQNGTVLQQSVTGVHTLRIINGLRKDAIIKLRSASRGNVLSLYVSANSTAQVDSVPSGLFDVLFATGTAYSRYCARFMQDMSAQKFDSPANFSTSEDYNYRYTTVIEYTLHRVPQGNVSASSYDESDFLRD